MRGKLYKSCLSFVLMRYEFAPDLQEKAEEISRILFPHIRMWDVKCYISYGTSSKRVIARCHALGKLMQKALRRPAFYALEFLFERFSKLSEEEKIKTIIHELMHIPYAFGGGFKHHDHVTEKNVNKMYKVYMERKSQNQRF